MWNMIHCAVQGRSHIKNGTPCQDKTCTFFRNGVSTIALADGAGSASLSHFGAQTTVEHICAELSEKFDQFFSEQDGVLVKRQLTEGVLQALMVKAIELGCELKELASTLLFVSVRDDRFIIAHIGDGVIGYCRNGELKIASEPENGEFANTTVFTTSKDALASMKLIKGTLGEITGFVLMSDGSEAGLYNKKEKRLADILRKVMSMSIILSAEKIQEQLRLSLENVISKATSDDCSIAVMADDRDRFKGYRYMSDAEKLSLLNLGACECRAKKLIQRYDEMIFALEEPMSVDRLSRELYLKPKYIRKYLRRLIALNLAEKDGACYRNLLIVDKK